MSKKKDKGNKNRKYGRARVGCERYRREGRREKNKARKLKRHLKNQPGDRAATAALKGLIG